MDPNTGRLRSLSEDESSMLTMMQKAEDLREERDAPEVEKLRGLEPLPEKLHKEAERELAGNEETFVDLKADTPLAKWAKDRRKISAAKKKKNRRKMTKKSQKNNRNK